MIKYDPNVEEWFPTGKRFRLKCCDCSLIHVCEFRIVDGEIQMRMFRHERSTALSRRHRKRVQVVDDTD